jgi:hypothetical protein
MGRLRFLYRQLDCWRLGDSIQCLEYGYYLGYHTRVNVEVCGSYSLWFGSRQIWKEMAVCGQQRPVHCS